jgi:type IV secretory pathway VirB10-like protein
VPIGDGLDYEVKETPEAVLAVLDGAPPAKVVPVPPPKTLTPRPDDVSPDVNPVDCDKAAMPEAAPSASKKPRKTKSSTVKKDVVAEPEKAEGAKLAAKRKRGVAKKQPEKPSLPDDSQKIVDGLKVRKCRTVKRLRNAMKSFHGKTDVEEMDRIIEEMMNIGLILVEPDGHVKWVEQVT